MIKGKILTHENDWIRKIGKQIVDNAHYKVEEIKRLTKSSAEILLKFRHVNKWRKVLIIHKNGFWYCNKEIKNSANRITYGKSVEDLFKFIEGK